MTAGVSGGGVAPKILVWQDGESWLGDASERGASISAVDRAFMLGDGLFETMRVHRGVPFALSAHLERLSKSARVLMLNIPESLPELIATVLDAGNTNGMFSGDCVMRVTVSRGAGTKPGLAYDPQQRATIVIALALLPPFEERIYSDGIRAAWAVGRRNEHASTSGHKTVDFVDAVVEFARARQAGLDDCLFIDTQGHLSEASTSNVFLFDGETLVTPALSCGALPGITRALVLDLAVRLSIPAEERVVEREELALASEAFLTNSLRELAPLVQVGNWRIGSGRPGDVTRLMAERYGEIRSQG